MKKALKISISAVIVFFLFSAAIIRKDIAIEKYFAFAHRPEFNFVGKMLYDDNTSDGACVLIGKKFVLTAAHLSAFKGGKTIMCQFGTRLYKVKRFIIHPRYEFKTYKGPDLAVLELEEEVKDIKPVQLYEDSTEKGKKGSIIGYGQIIFAGLIHSPTGIGERIGGQNMIDSIGGPIDPYLKKPTMCMADFDNPYDKRCCNVMGSAKPLPLEYGTSGGDSGGGLVFKIKGQWKLAGITHGGSNMKNPEWYGTISSWTRVSVYKDWIRQTVSELSKEQIRN